MKNNFYLYEVHAIKSNDPTKTFQECGIINASTYDEAVANLTHWYGDDNIFELTIESIGAPPIIFPKSIYEAIEKNDFTLFHSNNDIDQPIMNPQYFPS